MDTHRVITVEVSPSPELKERHLMTQRNYIAVITDPHVTEPGTKLYGMDTNQSAKRAFDTLARERLPQAVVFLGDLADTTLEPNRSKAVGSRGSYELAKEFASEIPVPILTIAGNHDDPKLMDEVFPNKWKTRKDGVSTFSFHGVDLIAVDVRTGPEAVGELAPETIKALEEVLSQSTGALIFSHFPLFDLDNERINTGLSTTNRQALEPILERYRDKIAHCFNGHLHIWASAMVGGVPVTATPSASFSFSLEPMAADRETLSDAPCGYLLVGIGADGSVTVRPRFLPGRSGLD